MEKQFLFAILNCVFPLILVLSHGQDIPGFISIDCGASNDYTDETTGIYYNTDLNYLDANRGENRSISSKYSTSPNTSQQYFTVRSFPKGRKNCYTLQTPKGKNHTCLIRASFMYGNYDQNTNFPVFDLYLGADKWRTVTVKDSQSIITMEIIQVIQTDYTYVCLVNTGFGVPFISVLELRLMNNDNGAYVTQSGSLELSSRFDMGSSSTGILRYKDDILDRIWQPSNNETWSPEQTASTVEPFNSFAPPSLVMRTAVTPIDVNGSLRVDWSTGDNTPAFIYLVMHFAEIHELSKNQSRQMTILMNGDLWYGPFVPQYLQSTSVYSVKTGKSSSFRVQIVKAENSTLPPILNAFEIFTVKEMITPLTNQDDVDGIYKIKSMYEQLKSTFQVERDWQGDPCTPSGYNWGGLNCTADALDVPRITSLNLSSSNLTGEINPDIAKLTKLKILDLSNNNLSGPLPEFLSGMLSLKFLYLENNNFSGPIPPSLKDRASKDLHVRTEGNLGLCSKDSCPEGKIEVKKKQNRIVIPIVASSVGVFLVLFLFSAGLFIYCRKKKNNNNQEQDSREIIGNRSNRLSQELDFIAQNLSYSQILKITNNFEEAIGKGGFGTVYRGVYNNSQVAVKMLSRSTAHGSKQFKTEARLLMRVHHRNLTALVGYCDEGSNMGLVYEYMSKGDLAWYLSEKNSQPLSLEERFKIALDTAQGLEYLHTGCKPLIVHRDVKTTNILLNEKLQAKLSDFGLSRAFQIEGDTHVSTVIAGTPGYLDPEYYVSNRLTEKSDVYSYGVVLLEIITGRTAIVKDKDEKNHIIEWVRNIISQGDITLIVDPRILSHDFNTNSIWKAVELAMGCVSQSSDRRPPMTNVVMELKQCLAMEMAGSSNVISSNMTESSEYFRVMPVHTDLGPLPR